MTVRVPAPDYQLPIVDSRLRQLFEFNEWVNEVNISIPLFGDGPPEGVVEAVTKQMYIDLTGDRGEILFIKRDVDDGAGDTSVGWINVSVVDT